MIRVGTKVHTSLGDGEVVSIDRSAHWKARYGVYIEGMKLDDGEPVNGVLYFARKWIKRISEND